MRKAAFMIVVTAAALLVTACSKSSNGLSSVYLTPSAATVTAGETVAVTLISNTNASQWTVSPSLNSKATYGITTSKVNYFTFTKSGVYTIAVNTRNVVYDSTSNQSLDSCWLHSSKTGGCIKGIDSASAKITVTN